MSAYVLVKVPGRGWLYEHRVVAERIIGRPLRRGEIVHHINGDKRDNRPENLEVVRSIAEHKAHHRRDGSRLRLPGEDNPITACACGCGARFTRFDESGRPRQFLPGGHWRRGRRARSVQRICRACGKLFLVYPSKLEEGRGVYCSRRCCHEVIR